MTGPRPLSLDFLLTIWPVAESIAASLPIGDLITLSRSNAALRASLHGELPYHYDARFSDARLSINPQIGHHQTPHWAHLKSLASMTCSDRTHVRGKTVRLCVYCSMPICDACIVRDSFKKRNENTFRNRLRFFCDDCWTEGRLSKSFRYLARPSPKVPSPDSNEFIEEIPETESEAHCDCTLKDNGWLCISCKDKQNNESPVGNESKSNTTTSATQCYGLYCTNAIDLATSDKDKRRICLWCQKPLRRRYGGEDRLAWNLKTIEARAANAESRSRDIEEYNRKRMRSLRMSRNEMRRGMQGGNSQDDKPDLVRHLDTINYRIFLTGPQCPTPDDVYKSKMGIWRYDQAFLLAVGRSLSSSSRRPTPNELSLENITKDGSPDTARTNRLLKRDFISSLLMDMSEEDCSTLRHLNELKTKIIYLHTHSEATLPIDEIRAILSDDFGVETSTELLEEVIRRWTRDPEHDESAKPGGTQAQRSPSQHAHGSTTQNTSHDNFENDNQSTRTRTHSPSDPINPTTNPEPTEIRPAYARWETSETSTTTAGTSTAADSSTSETSTEEEDDDNDDDDDEDENDNENENDGETSTDDPPPYTL